MSGTPTYKPYQLTFTKPLVTAVGAISHREGIIITYTFPKPRFSASNETFTAHADVAPLPGFSDETLAEALDWLINSEEDLLHYVNQAPHNISDKFSGHITQVIEEYAINNASYVFKVPPPPSVWFALDSLILQYLHCKNSQNRHVPLTKLSIPVNTIVRDLAEADASVLGGFNTVKIKVGVDFDSELAFIKALRDKYPHPNMLRIRLDANGVWPLEVARKNLEALSGFQIEYIEQPVSQNDLIWHGQQLRRLGIPIAADESARTVSQIKTLLKNESCDICILKPAMIGSLADMLIIRSLCAAKQVNCVITTSLESSVGRYNTAMLAGLFFNTGLAHGLATGHLLKQDISNEPDEILAGNRIIDPCKAPRI